MSHAKKFRTGKWAYCSLTVKVMRTKNYVIVFLNVKNRRRSYLSFAEESRVAKASTAVEHLIRSGVMSMKKVKSKTSLKRSGSSHPDDLEAIPSCTGIKFIGDPVESIRYRQGEYDPRLKRLVSLQLHNTSTVDTMPDNGDMSTNDDLNRDTKSPLGFDLMSLTSSRGHFIDHVIPKSKAEVGGLQVGDLIVEVNGTKIRDMAHEEVVQLIRQSSSEDAAGEAIHFTIVSKRASSSSGQKEGASGH